MQNGKFQSTLPRGERQHYCILCTINNRFQSTLPRGERQSGVYTGCVYGCNFNPRSREGSDCIARSEIYHAEISIHAPARGATGSRTGISVQCKRFQSTLPRGERLVLYNYRKGQGDFNPRSREGSDELIERLNGEIMKFQSTLPRGERLPSHITYSLLQRFQSTLPRGERPLLLRIYYASFKISIHAPARGATENQ